MVHLYIILSIKNICFNFSLERWVLSDGPLYICGYLSMCVCVFLCICGYVIMCSIVICLWVIYRRIPCKSLKAWPPIPLRHRFVPNANCELCIGSKPFLSNMSYFYWQTSIIIIQSFEPSNSILTISTYKNIRLTIWIFICECLFNCTESIENQNNSDNLISIL